MRADRLRYGSGNSSTTQEMQKCHTPVLGSLAFKHGSLIVWVVTVFKGNLWQMYVARRGKRWFLAWRSSSNHRWICFGRRHNNNVAHSLVNQTMHNGAHNTGIILHSDGINAAKCSTNRLAYCKNLCASLPSRNAVFESLQPCFLSPHRQDTKSDRLPTRERLRISVECIDHLCCRSGLYSCWFRGLWLCIWTTTTNRSQTFRDIDQVV